MEVLTIKRILGNLNGKTCPTSDKSNKILISLSEGAFANEE